MEGFKQIRGLTAEDKTIEMSGILSRLIERICTINGTTNKDLISKLIMTAASGHWYTKAVFKPSELLLSDPVEVGACGNRFEFLSKVIVKRLASVEIKVKAADIKRENLFGAFGIWIYIQSRKAVLMARDESDESEFVILPPTWKPTEGSTYYLRGRHLDVVLHNLRRMDKAVNKYLDDAKEKVA